MKKTKSDGKSTSYYDFPVHSSTLNDLIEYKKMDFARGNIFKAAYRLGEKSGTDDLYDLNKIIYYAERLKNQIEKKDDNFIYGPTTFLPNFIGMVLVILLIGAFI